MCVPANLSASKSLAFLWSRMPSVNIRRESIVRVLCAYSARIIFPSEVYRARFEGLVKNRNNYPILILLVAMDVSWAYN